jgi:nitric oxide reductase NorD protein
MAEAEEVITDAARHATVFARDLWRRYRPKPDGATNITLDDLAPRIDMLVFAVFSIRFPIRVAQAPAPATLLGTVFRHDQSPRQRVPIPATDGISIWLPRDVGITNPGDAANWYRVAALEQCMRAKRGGAGLVDRTRRPLLRDVFIVLEAYNSDEALAAMLPGIRHSITESRRRALSLRPPLDDFPAQRQPLERLVRHLLETECGRTPSDIPITQTAEQSLELAEAIASGLVADRSTEKSLGSAPLLKDAWTGEFKFPDPSAELFASDSSSTTMDDPAPSRSSRLDRRPTIRSPGESEDDDKDKPGPWMVHADHPHEIAEDPMGLQRPIDRDDQTSAAEFGEMLSELPEARLVSTPGRPREILLSDDPPQSRMKLGSIDRTVPGEPIRYPEWDYRTRTYREPGATVHLVEPVLGSRDWVDRTLEEHRSMLARIRKQFEMLRAEPVILRRRLDGEDIDLDAYVENHVNFSAGLPRTDALYLTRRPARQSIAITVLIDVSGSTDSWISGHRRIIDVEREALLLLCIALDGLGEPYAVQAFSGEGPHGVTIRDIKQFSEPYNNEVARRIEALEPESYTRAGAAIRHATSSMMHQTAVHRLLLLLSDGKPNDIDEYEGRYGSKTCVRRLPRRDCRESFPFA